MSNEMISVPRESVLALLGDDQLTRIKAHAELRALLDKPAEQHQGEPVAVVIATGGPHDTEDRVLAELQAELPPVGTKLYARPAAQHQGEPVSSTSDKYKAELYDEVWQLARDMGFGNVTDALMKLQGNKTR